ncbi:MAG: phosphatase PAP2 family protein [Pseudomonadota bacterium]
MHTFLLKADQFELRACLTINGLGRFALARQLFRLVSRLGDGIFWYAGMGLIAGLTGPDGFAAMTQVALTSCVGVMVYRSLKGRLVRPRPFVSHGQIVCGIAPLDQYSFPSGHTLHAVLFASMFAMVMPATLWICLPFALLVAISRVVLGLHYPSDVIVGALLGLILGGVSCALVTLPQLSLPVDMGVWLALWGA